MKKIIAIFLVFMMCVSFTACKNDGEENENTNEQQIQNKCTEQDIRMLIEQNIDCYYLFCVAPLNGEGVDSDGYSKAEMSFFANYQELEAFVKSTYTAEKSEYYLNQYPSKDNPLYKERNGAVYVDLDAVSGVEYTVAWDDNYTVSFNESDESRCSFTLTTADFYGEPYVTSGEAVFENGEWLLTDFVY